MVELEYLVECFKKHLGKYVGPDKPICSIYFVGSYASGEATDRSDIDILIITAGNATGEEIESFGISLHEALSLAFPNENLFLFDSPAIELYHKCKPNYKQRCVQLLIHRDWWVKKSLFEKNWVFISWSMKCKKVLGESLLEEPNIPVLNRSIIDYFDGLQAMLRQIDALLIRGVSVNNPEIAKNFISYTNARLSEIQTRFPKVLSSKSLNRVSQDTGMATLLIARKNICHAIEEINRAISCQKN